MYPRPSAPDALPGPARLEASHPLAQTATSQQATAERPHRHERVMEDQPYARLRLEAMGRRPARHWQGSMIVIDCGAGVLQLSQNSAVIQMPEPSMPENFFPSDVARVPRSTLEPASELFEYHSSASDCRSRNFACRSSRLDDLKWATAARVIWLGRYRPPSMFVFIWPKSMVTDEGPDGTCTGVARCRSTL